MNLVTIKGQTYNLDHMVRYISHMGQREVGVTQGPGEPRPIFGDYRYLELVFVDGARVELDGIQSDALLRHLAAQGPALDLDLVDEAVLGHVLVRDSESGDVILPSEEESDEEQREEEAASHRRAMEKSRAPTPHDATSVMPRGMGD